MQFISIDNKTVKKKNQESVQIYVYTWLVERQQIENNNEKTWSRNEVCVCVCGDVPQIDLTYSSSLWSHKYEVLIFVLGKKSNFTYVYLVEIQYASMDW